MEKRLCIAIENRGQYFDVLVNFAEKAVAAFFDDDHAVGIMKQRDGRSFGFLSTCICSW